MKNAVKINDVSAHKVPKRAPTRMEWRRASESRRRGGGSRGGVDGGEEPVGKRIAKREKKSPWVGGEFYTPENFRKFPKIFGFTEPLSTLLDIFGSSEFFFRKFPKIYRNTGIVCTKAVNFPLRDYLQHSDCVCSFIFWFPALLENPINPIEIDRL